MSANRLRMVFSPRPWFFVKRGTFSEHQLLTLGPGKILEYSGEPPIQVSPREPDAEDWLALETLLASTDLT